MKVLILHGWGADSQSNWFPWLKNELEQNGIEAYCPDLPNTNYPKKDAWLSAIRELVPKFNEKDDWVLVGHSLGCPTILHLLETFGNGEKVRAAILVSGFAADLGIPDIRDLLNGGFDFKKIKKCAKEFIIINSDNDPYVPLDVGKQLADSLGTNLLLEPGEGHINIVHEEFKYDRVLNIINGLRSK